MDNDILSLIDEQAQIICAAGKDSDGHEKRVKSMAIRLQGLVARCFAAYDNDPALVVDVCGHGCVIDPWFGLVIDGGCPVHDADAMDNE